ncbi:MAG: porin family protein [Porphyromonas sp.]|nr:porin family protein [Porphyromonas sp.]
MKRIYTAFAVILVALIGMSSANAQGFRWGLMGGANFSKFSTNTEELSGQLFTAFHVGPMVEYELPIFPVAIEAGVLYSQKGMDMQMAGEDALNLKSNMIELPVNLKAYLFSIPAARFFVVAGPSFNFALNTEVKDMKINELNNIQANKVGINLNAGIGVEVLKHLQLSATFNAAMNDSYKLEGVSEAYQDFIGTKEKGFSVTARVLF